VNVWGGSFYADNCNFCIFVRHSESLNGHQPSEGHRGGKIMRILQIKINPC
jgi:hypothetical protein